MSDTENTVVPFRVAKSLLESHVKKPVPPKSQYCRHRHSEMDSLERTVTCTDCGATLDPFDWMERTLDENARYWREQSELKKEIGSLHKKVEELKDEEKRVKARLRNARDALAKEASREKEQKPLSRADASAYLDQIRLSLDGGAA